MSYMACMEDLLLQKGCLKAYATFCLCGFWKVCPSSAGYSHVKTSCYVSRVPLQANTGNMV